MVSSFPLGEIIQCREALGRIAKWAVEIMGETISFAPRKAIKSQVLADFVAEWVDTQLPTAPIQPELWTMFFDGSLMKTGAGIGVHLGRAWWVGPKHRKKARPRHDTTRNSLVSGRHGPLYRAGFGPRSRPMGGHEHDPFKAGTKWPI
jgi:hypothetical protein